MIKPYKILQTRTEVDGTIGVIYSVSQTTSQSATVSDEKTMQAYMVIPEGWDIDEYLFEQLSKAGWF
jgi:hypothetical protein